jgi:RNA polymerase sigma-70 factor (ECF subfamily)
VYAILGCRDEAEDVAQETFVKAYRAVGTYRLRYPYVAWLRRIAVNAAISQLRRRRRSRRVEEIDAMENPGPATHPVEHVAAAERGASVRRAVEGLPLKQRLAVTLFHLEDMSLADAADAMGCSVGAVKSHLHRARETLALRLSPHLKEAEL